MESMELQTATNITRDAFELSRQPDVLLKPRANWRDPRAYPEIENNDSRAWAWEFLRRNAWYEADYVAAASPRLIDWGDDESAANPQLQAEDDWENRLSAERVRDALTVRWQISFPLSPLIRWSGLPHHLTMVKGLRPKLFWSQSTDPLTLLSSETLPLSSVTVPLSPEHVVVRLQLGEDIASQVRAMESELLRLCESRFTDDETTLKKAEISRVKKSADRRERMFVAGVRKRHHALEKRPECLEWEDAEIQIVRMVLPNDRARVSPKYRHFSLRVLDAIAEAPQFPTRAALRNFGLDIKDIDFSHEQQALGLGSGEWLTPLIDNLIEVFNQELKKRSVTHEGFRGQLPGTFKRRHVHSWATAAWRYALQGGYTQLATSTATTKNDE